MRFSIIVPVYNSERYLEFCIQSVLQQSLQSYELILVNDGSTDGSGKICDEYQKKHESHVKVIHKKNQGPLAARIDGLSIADGEFVIFIDADDFIEQDALKIIDTYLENDELDILIYSFRYYRNNQMTERFHSISEDGYTWTQQNKKEIYEKLAFSMELNSLWTKVIRMSLLKQDKTDYTAFYGKNMAEDLLFSLYPITYAREIKYIDKVLYNYRINEVGLAHNFSINKIENKNSLHVYEKILEYFPMWRFDSEQLKSRLAARWFDDVMYIFSKYYEGAKKDERSEILSYKWDAMLPRDAMDMDNPYMNIEYKKLYVLLKEGKRTKIYIFFVKKKIYKIMKKWKKTILK